MNPLEVPRDALAEIECLFKIPEPDPVSTGVGKWFCLSIDVKLLFYWYVERWLLFWL